LNSLFWIWTLLWSRTGRRKTWLIAQPAKGSLYLSNIVVEMSKCRCGRSLSGWLEHQVLLCNINTGGAAVMSTHEIMFTWLASYMKTARLCHFHLLNSRGVPLGSSVSQSTWNFIYLNFTV
jgi:hypothetical protein